MDSNTTWSVEAVEVPAITVERWQNLADLLARLADVSAALVMRLVGEDIEVFVSSRSEGNPYRVGAREHFFDSGLYCERVVREGRRLLVPDALADPDWRDNPDVELSMIAYLGLPIRNPDGSPFGTLCILDDRPTEFTADLQELMARFRDLLEGQLELIHANLELGTENRRLGDLVAEIRALRSILPVCSHCHKVRDDDGRWQPIEGYLESAIGTRLSHGLCPDCLVEHYPTVRFDELQS